MSMNLRHAAALALVGWALMLPPYYIKPGNTGTGVNPTAPWTDWFKADSFDTLKKCVEFQIDIIRAGARMKLTAESSADPKSERLVSEQFLASQCVPTTDLSVPTGLRK